MSGGAIVRWGGGDLGAEEWGSKKEPQGAGDWVIHLGVRIEGLRNKGGNLMQWKNLNVWKKAHNHVLEVYKITLNFPKEELYGLTNQIKRAAISVPANIAEGQSRNTTKEYIQFLYHSRGSLEEVRYHLLLSKDLGFLNQEDYKTMELNCEEISKMLNGLINSLKTKSSKQK